MREKEYNENDYLEFEEEYEESGADKKNTSSGGGKGGSSEKILKAVIAIVVVAIVVVAAVAGYIYKRAQKPAEETTAKQVEEISTSPEEVLTKKPEAVYTVGTYKVNIAPADTLNLREKPARDAKVITTVKKDEVLRITDIVVDTSDSKETINWGKATYKGYDVWVTMKYLTKTYGEEPVSEVPTTNTAETTTEKASEAEVTTTKPAEVTTTKVPEATVPSSSAKGPSKPGTYTVDADDFIRVRENHTVYSEALCQIEKGREVTVTEVYHDKEANDKYTVYWGKITYDGFTGWVAMGYLK